MRAGSAFLPATVFRVLGIAVCIVAGGLFLSRTLGLPPGVAIPATFALGLIGYGAMQGRPYDVTIDEGGVRYRRGRRGGYVPFAGLHTVTLRARRFGRDDLLLQGDLLTLRLPIGEGAPDLERVVRGRIHRLSETVDLDPGLADLERRERPLVAWLEDARTMALNHTLLEETLVEERNTPDLRAAAAYVLLKDADAACRDRVALAVGPGAPPIVVAAAAVADPVRVEPRLVEDIRAYLSDADRAAIHAATARS